MTYCLALRLDEGLLFLADTRTNAGVDNVGTYGKQHVLRPADDRVFVIESAGSLATTQEVLDRISRDLETNASESLATVEHLFEAALYIGRLSREVAAEHHEALAAINAESPPSPTSPPSPPGSSPRRSCADGSVRLAGPGARMEVCDP